MLTDACKARPACSAPILHAPTTPLNSFAPDKNTVNAPTLPFTSTLRRRWLGVFLLAWVAGCSTPTPWPSSGGSGDPVPGSRPSPPPSSPLVSEQRWFEEWFRGTPVVIVMADVNTLAVDVPLANSFDNGKINIKPALAAVLDRVATSLRRQPTIRISIAAPSDASGINMSLASSRAQQVRDHLVSRGVPATRMSGVGTARAGAAVQLRMVTTPQAIGRLDDASLPPPSAGLKPAAAAPTSATKR